MKKFRFLLISYLTHWMSIKRYYLWPNSVAIADSLYLEYFLLCFSVTKEWLISALVMSVDPWISEVARRVNGFCGSEKAKE